MKPLERRIEKLEAKTSEKENFVWARAPEEISDAECRAKVEEEIGDRFAGEDYRLTINRAHNITEFEIYMVGDTHQLREIMKKIAKNPKPLSYDEGVA